MFIHPRSLIRAAAGAAGALALTAASAVPAMADAPEGWEKQDVSAFSLLLVLAILPLGLALLIALLASLGGWRKGENYVPGQAWRGDPEWFGGPRKGVEAAEESDQRLLGTGETGGSSGTW